jgi:hypothetical protein
MNLDEYRTDARTNEDLTLLNSLTSVLVAGHTGRIKQTA